MILNRIKLNYNIKAGSIRMKLMITDADHGYSNSMPNADTDTVHQHNTW